MSGRCFAIRIPFVHVSSGLSTRIKILLRGRVLFLFGKYKTGGNGPEEWPTRNFNVADDMIFLFAHYLHFGGERSPLSTEKTVYFFAPRKIWSVFRFFLLINSGERTFSFLDGIALKWNFIRRSIILYDIFLIV